MKHTRRVWTPAEDERLSTLYATFSADECAAALDRTRSSVCQRVNAIGLRKSPEWIAQTARMRTLNPTHGGRRGQFKPGLVPWNTGRSHPARGRSVETQFKRGRAPQESRNYLPIGSERLTKDGYVERKVTDDQSVVPARRWTAVHRLVWEAANGPVPPGRIVVFRRGMHTTVVADIAIDRLELITRAENMARNTIHNYPPEVKGLIRAVKRAERALEKRCE